MMNRKNLLHIFTVVLVAVFVVLGQGCLTVSEAVKNAASVDELTNLRDKFAWLSVNAETGSNYVLEVVAPESLSRPVNLTYRNKSDITITLRGMGGVNQAISTNDALGLFSVGSGVTLILDNITLQGVSSGILLNSGTLVSVRNGGTLIMKDGSTITGHTNDGDGGGVYVSDGGIFLMEGGTIIRNFSCFTVGSAQQYAQSRAAGRSLVGSATSQIPGYNQVSGTASSNADNTPLELPPRSGGGVYVAVGGTFTKTGGTIAGFAGTPDTSNAVIDPNARPISDSGHAVFAATGTRSGIFISNPGSKRKETTSGPNSNLHIGSDGTFSGDWDF